jgi:hypothetical protein
MKNTIALMFAASTLLLTGWRRPICRGPPPLALFFSDQSGVTSRVGGGSAFFVRRQLLPATVFNLIMKTTIVLCVASFSLFAAVFQTKADIIAGPIKNPTNGNYYYLLSPNIWTASEAEAESIGGTLAIIKNADEQKWVFSTFNAYDGVNHVGIWIGLHRTTLGGPFAWVTGATLDYTNWNQGEPNNVGGIENCVHMCSGDSTAPGTWNDLPDNTFNDRKYGVVELSGSFFATFTSMCRSRNCLGETAAGESVIRSVPLAVLGKAITSRMLGVPQRMRNQRSKPSAMPPCGGAP